MEREFQNVTSFCDPEHNSTRPSIQRVPDNILELIFTFLNPYEDYNSIKYYVEGEHLLSERCSHAACYHPSDYAMYIFGGCTNTYTAFNDLWLFDLSRRGWERVIITRPPLPSPKALASLVLFEKNLLLFGGFSKSSMNPIHQTNTFYNELHLFNRISNCWEEVISENTAPHLAGHSATVVAHFMLVFGGSMGSSYNNNVYVLDLNRRIWNMPTIPGPCPPPRYGQSQILIDDHHLIVIGGCGGPNLMYSDVWLLEFDIFGDNGWRWTQIKVDNPDMTPPFTWCHRAEKVGEHAVLVSRPVKWRDCTSACRRSNKHGRRRTSSQSTNASGGSGRLASPDSPLDRKAVAAAFGNEQLHQENRRGNDGRGKPVLLTSRSLDDQQQRTNEGMAMESPESAGKSLQNSPSTSTNLTVTDGTFSTSQQKNAGELHRACSIPAIIVGEIPKLIVTVEPTHRKPNVPATAHKAQMATANPKLRFDSLLNQSDSPLSSGQAVGSFNDPLLKSSISEGSISASVHDDAVHEYYLSLVREEFHRLCIVEFSENLGTIDQKLEEFLGERAGYLTRSERMAIIVEFMQSVSGAERTAQPSQSRNVSDSGQLRSRKKVPISSEENSEKQKLPQNRKFITDEQSCNSTGNTHSEGSLLCNTSYDRKLCVYVLGLSKILNEHRVRWEQLPIEEDAPEDKLLYSFVACRGELILFGGMQSDGSGMASLNVGLERRVMSSETYILRPRYHKML